jgi:glycosyltransferase involved in cell wall biosynthesis
MRILMYLPQPGPTRAPEVAASLARLGSQVVVVSPPERQMLEVGVKIRRIRFTWIPLLGLVLLIVYGTLLAAVTMIRRRPDVIYTLGGSMGTGLLLARLFRRPLITECNGYRRAELKLESKHPFWMFVSRASVWLDEKENERSDQVIVVIDNIKRALVESLKITPDRITVVPNGANTDLFKPIANAREKTGLPVDCHYVGFAGNVAPWQGLDHLVRSAPAVLKEVPDTRFLIVGDGTSKVEIGALVEELNVTDHFDLVGQVPYPDVPLYINAMDVCIAFRKGTPASVMKNFEYMACARPVIATNDADNHVVKEQNAGVLVDPEDAGQVANAIVRLLRDDELRSQMGRNGVEYVVANRTWEAVAREVEATMRAVVDR